jgi:ApaG protein
MRQNITEEMKVSAEAFYLPNHSSPLAENYIFGYRITIENLSHYPMQLLKRKWEIWDSDGSVSEENEEGVQGQQPVLLGGEKYQYVATCHLKTEMGRIRGSYLFDNLHTHLLHRIYAPEFEMIAPFKNN